MFLGTVLSHLIVCVLCCMVSSTTCPPPEGSILWDATPGEKVVDVVWGYNSTCHTTETCNGSQVEDGDLIFTSEDEVLVQLQPLELQMGNILRFRPSDYVSFPFSILPYYVDEIGFVTCNISRGVPILAEETNHTFEVPQKYLKEGNSYFIVDSSNHTTVSCPFGLRLNVTVKSSSCHTSHKAMCSGWGLCITYSGQSSFDCHCCGNYRGDNCEIFDSCLSYPCKNEGVCYHPANNSHEFACHCPLEYYGKVCEHQREDLCEVVSCENNATCNGNSTSFECECPSGLTGTHCEIDVNECETSPCTHGTCVDDRNGFHCHCDPGYHGDTCSEQHRKCSLNPCQNGGFCQDVTTSVDHFNFTCHCKPGWAGRDCTQKVPACDPNPCKHGTCEEKNGTFTCKCKRGFTGSRCEVNINDCKPNPCKFGGHCRDGVHSHTCLCIHSHAGSNCQFTLDLFSPILEDVDAAGGIIHNPRHTRNLYIVAGTLTAAVIVMMVVLMGCYCRVSGSYRNCCGLSRLFRYQKHRDDMRVCVDVTSASDCPLAVDAFWKPMDSESDIMHSTSRNSFQNHTV